MISSATKTAIRSMSLSKVFVYGTLKRGEPNHHWITDSSKGAAKFIGMAKTVNKYPLIIATKHNIPFLLDSPDNGHNVTGEVYEVDEGMLANLDELEDHPAFYVRRQDNVKLLKTGEVIDQCWIYFITRFKEALMKGPFLESYSSSGSHGLTYQESYLEPSSINDLISLIK